MITRISIEFIDGEVQSFPINPDTDNSYDVIEYDKAPMLCLVHRGNYTTEIPYTAIKTLNTYWS